jgi:hypothetical protein
MKEVMKAFFDLVGIAFKFCVLLLIAPFELLFLVIGLVTAGASAALLIGILIIVWAIIQFIGGVLL